MARQLSYRLGALLCIASSVSAWSFTWRNADGDAKVEHSHSPQNCTQIDHAEGEYFRYNPEDDLYSIWLYDNKNCSGPQSGWAPSLWEKKASLDLLSFRVGPEDDSPSSTTTTTTTTTTATTATPTSTSTTTTETETPTSSPNTSSTPTTAPESSGSSSPSGGAIAGIVIGALAGVGIIGALLFFLGRRKRAAPPDPAPQESGSAPGPDTDPAPPSPAASLPPPPLSTVGMKAELDATPLIPKEGKHDVDNEVYKSPITEVESPITPGYRGPPARAMVELPGHEVTVEMSDTHRLNELEGSAMPKR